MLGVEEGLAAMLLGILGVVKVVGADITLTAEDEPVTVADEMGAEPPETLNRPE